MELEDIKIAWQKQKDVGYSTAELDSIYRIKQNHVLNALRRGFSFDLITSILLSAMFIVYLQIINLSTSNFWSVCMLLLIIQHLIIYQLQIYLIRKYSVFKLNINHSITISIRRLRNLLWLYRLWPTLLGMVLYTVYVVRFASYWQVWQILATGAIIIIVIMAMSDLLSAVLVRKHYKRLKQLKADFDTFSNRD
jgi:hypothetical protein